MKETAAVVAFQCANLINFSEMSQIINGFYIKIGICL